MTGHQNKGRTKRAISGIRLWNTFQVMSGGRQSCKYNVLGSKTAWPSATSLLPCHLALNTPRKCLLKLKWHENSPLVQRFKSRGFWRVKSHMVPRESALKNQWVMKYWINLRIEFQCKNYIYLYIWEYGLLNNLWPNMWIIYHIAAINTTVSSWKWKEMCANQNMSDFKRKKQRLISFFSGMKGS